MSDVVKEWAALLGSVEFWMELLSVFKDFGPVAPILFTCVESFVPVLPLVVIVTLNITAHGALLGFFYSWIGTSIGCTVVFLICRKFIKPHVHRWGSQNALFTKAINWVSGISGKALFVIAMMPFTPSVFVNLAFGLSDFDEVKFLKLLISAKSVMMILLGMFGNSVSASFNDARFLILASFILLMLWGISRIVRKKHGL